jgi:hypothetical protein
MGSRGYGPLGRVVLGSVSEPVSHQAPCPVWITPRPASTAEAAREGARAMAHVGADRLFS